MSLINDMLRDLSQRQPVLEGAEGYDEQLLKTSTITAKKNYAWVKLSVFFAMIFVSVLAINYFTTKSLKNSPGVAIESKKISVVNNLSETNPAPIHVAIPANVPISTHVDNIASSNAVGKLSEEVAGVELQNHINDLLQQAERAMLMDRLTAPIEDNAYGYYQKILNMNTDNDAAKEGLDKIAQRYLTKAQEQSQLGNLSQAEALLQRARFVSARFVDAHTTEFNELTNQSSAIQSLQSAAQPSQSATQPSQSATQPSQLIVQSAGIVQSGQTETIKPFEVVEAPALVESTPVLGKENPAVSVQPNAGWKDEQLASYAQELIQKGKQAEAQTLLKNFVASEKKPALSAALLTELYIQQANSDAANIILEKTDYLPVDIKTKLKAQLFSLQGNDVQAITLLEENLTAADGNEAYRSLLASLYHKTANYPQSILSYQRLLSSFGERPAYWLGLALAYDGLSQSKNALQAYLRLREFPQLQDQVKQYSDQRIAALRSQ